jgi:hypothetical protein
LGTEWRQGWKQHIVGIVAAAEVWRNQAQHKHENNHNRDDGSNYTRALLPALPFGERHSERSRDMLSSEVIMLPENEPNPTVEHPAEPDIDPISPEEAEAIMEAALEPYLADGWLIVDRTSYATRLTRGMSNLDVRIDLLGQTQIEESNLTPLQNSGRLVAWVLLLAALLVMLALSSALGIL